MDYIIKTENLTKRFGRESAVRGLNMHIQRGEIYGFLGPNGAGKTTTIRMLLGLMKPTGGNVRIFNQDLKREKVNILQKVGSLVENPSYYPHLTAAENLEALRKILNVPKKRIHEVLDIVRLTEVADKKVKGFSLGMKQRLGIAAALLNKPELLILDEPTNGLDPSGIIEIRNLIKRLPKEQNMTVLLSSHLLSEIDQMATTVGIILKGELIFEDSIHVLRQQSGQKILIKTSDSQVAAKMLTDHRIKAEWQGGMVCLPECEDDRVAQAINLLVSKGFSIYRVEEEKRSLEDIFLNMTGEGALDARETAVG